jgi:hypothetical protein
VPHHFHITSNMAPHVTSTSPPHHFHITFTSLPLHFHITSTSLRAMAMPWPWPRQGHAPWPCHESKAIGCSAIVFHGSFRRRQIRVTQLSASQHMGLIRLEPSSHRRSIRYVQGSSSSQLPLKSMAMAKAPGDRSLAMAWPWPYGHGDVAVAGWPGAGLDNAALA